MSIVHSVSSLEEARQIELKEKKLPFWLHMLRALLVLRLTLENGALNILHWCWFAATIEKPKDLLTIVVYMHGTLGDHIILLPFIAALKKNYPSAGLTAVTLSGDFPIADLLRSEPYIDEIIILNDHPVTRDGLRFRFTNHSLASLRCDLFVNLSPFGNRGVLGFVLREMIFARKIRARYAIGFHMFSLGKKGILNKLHRYFLVNEPRRAASVLREINIGIEGMRDCLPRNGIERAKILDLLHSKRAGNQPIILLNPGAKLAYQCWPPERYGYIARWLSQTYNVCVVVNGTKSENPLVEKVVAVSGGAAVNLAGIVSIQGLIELVRLSALCITNNTGTMHVAAAVGTPTVALFGTRWTPTHWFPLASKVRLLFSFSSSSYVYADDNQPDETLMNVRIEDTQQAIMDFVALEKLFDKPTENR